MTSNKIASVFLVDLQKSSKEKCHLHNTIQCLSQILLRKIMANDGDEGALITFGSATTNNPLFTEGQDCYEHIDILQPLQTVSWDLREAVESLEPSQVDDSDCFQAIVVATDLIRSQIKLTKRRFKEIQIFLFSNFTSDTSVSDNNRASLLNVLTEYKVRLIVVGAEEKTEGVSSSLDAVLDVVKSLPNGKMMSFSECFKNIEYFPQKRRSPREMKINMTIGSIGVPVVWVKITEAKKSRIQFGLLVTSETEKYGKGFIRRKEVESDEPLEIEVEEPRFNHHISFVTDDKKAVSFMGQEVTLNYADLESVQRQSGPASFSLLGFTKQRNIHRLMFQSTEIYSVKPQKSPESRCLFTALLNSLLETEKVAIGRRITMKNGKVLLGALVPAPRPHKCLYFMRLPYAEWVRSAPPVRWVQVPDDSECMEVVDKYMDTLLLGEDAFTPEKGLQLLNPSFQVACHVIQDTARGLLSDQNEDLPSHLKRLFTPILTSTEEERSLAIKELDRVFPPPPPKEERRRKRRAPKPGDNDLVLDSIPGVVARDDDDVKRMKQEIRDQIEEELQATKAKMKEEIPTINTMDALDDL